MQSSLIGKIEKAKRYAQETERITFSQLSVKFRGEHDDYNTDYQDGKWECSCHFFRSWGICSHTMALQRILSKRLALGRNFNHGSRMLHGLPSEILIFQPRRHKPIYDHSQNRKTTNRQTLGIHPRRHDETRNDEAVSSSAS